MTDGADIGTTVSSRLTGVVMQKGEPMDDTISRQWLMECVNEGWIKFDTEKDENRFVHLVRDIAPSAQLAQDLPNGCTDTISRRAAIDAILKRDANCGIDAAETLETLPSAQRWIPAHNIFPGENGKYLATGKHGAVNIIKYEDGRWYGGMKPLAWMPIPEPWKGEEND